VIHQTAANYFDGRIPFPRAGRLVYDAQHRELHFYEKPSEKNSQPERFAFSLNREHHFEIRHRGSEHVIEWRTVGNHTSELLVIDDPAFMRFIRDRFLSHKHIFWRYATYVWSESLARVSLALASTMALTSFCAWIFMQNSYRLAPVSWDQKIGEQAEPGLSEFGKICASPQTVKDLKSLLPYLVPADSPYGYQIEVLNSNVENAFALPGGKVIFFSQTIHNAESYAELAGILAHEAGHVERRHGMQQISQYMTIRLVLALAFGMTDDTTMLSFAADAGAILLLLKNSRGHERDADAYAAESLAQAGISSQAIRNFFTRIGDEHQDGKSKIPDFILTHPADEDRIAFFSRYERKHEGLIKKASRRLRPEIRLLLQQKPKLSQACAPPAKQQSAQTASGDDESD
jgi:Zn-dependent protease with chaperone function